MFPPARIRMRSSTIQVRSESSRSMEALTTPPRSLPQTRLGPGYYFNPCGQDAVLSVIHEDSPDNYSVVENVKTQAGARTMALDEQTHNVYLAIAEYEAAAPAPPAGADGKAAPRPRRKMVAGSFGLLVFGK